MILVELPRDDTSDMAQPRWTKSANRTPRIELLAPHRLAGGGGTSSSHPKEITAPDGEGERRDGLK